MSKTSVSLASSLDDIAEELDDAISNVSLSLVSNNQELYRLVMASQSAIAALRLTSNLMEIPTQR